MNAKEEKSNKQKNKKQFLRFQIGFSFDAPGSKLGRQSNVKLFLFIGAFHSLSIFILHVSSCLWKFKRKDNVMKNSFPYLKLPVGGVAYGTPR